jgi:hypothetical protein
MCYPLRLLKNSSVCHLRWLACLKGPCFFFRIPVGLHCPPTVCPNSSPKPFSQSREIARLWTSDLDKSQVRGQVRQLCQGYKEKPLSAILCCVFAQLEWAHACILLIKRILPCQDFSVSCMSVFGTRGLLIPTLFPLHSQQWRYKNLSRNGCTSCFTEHSSSPTCSLPLQYPVFIHLYLPNGNSALKGNFCLFLTQNRCWRSLFSFKRHYGCSRTSVCFPLTANLFVDSLFSHYPPKFYVISKPQSFFYFSHFFKHSLPLLYHHSSIIF